MHILKNKKGFTLVEMVIVMLMIGILIAAMYALITPMAKIFNKQSQLTTAKNAANLATDLIRMQVEYSDSIMLLDAAKLHQVLAAPASYKGMVCVYADQSSFDKIMKTVFLPTGTLHNSALLDKGMLKINAIRTLEYKLSFSKDTGPNLNINTWIGNGSEMIYRLDAAQKLENASPVLNPNPTPPTPTSYIAILYKPQSLVPPATP